MREKNKLIPKFHLTFEFFILFAVLLSHLIVAVAPENKLLNWYQTDDAFYYFKTAQNIAEGRGITFDGISPTNGFHPLWMVICVPIFALARFNLFLPLRVLVVLQSLITAITGILIYRLLSKHLFPQVGILVVLIWMFYPPVHSLTTMLGMESGINATSIILLLYLTDLWINHQKSGTNPFPSYLYLGLIAGVTLFSRLDNIFLVVLLGIWIVFRDNSLRWRIMLDAVCLFVICVISYFLRLQMTPNLFNFLPFFYVFTILSIVSKVLSAYFLGIYQVSHKQTLIRQFIQNILSVSIGSVISVVSIFLLHDVLAIFNGFPRSVLVLDWFFSVILMTPIHLVLNHYRNGSEDLSLSKNWRIWLARTIAYFTPWAGMLGVYMVFNKTYAGMAMPISGQIKRWWGTLPNTVYGTPIKTISGIISSWFSPSTKDGPWSLITGPLNKFGYLISQWLSSNSTTQNWLMNLIELSSWILIFALVLVICRRYGLWLVSKIDHLSLLPLGIACVFHILSYKATGYLHAKYWYWISEMVLVVLASGIILDFLFDKILKNHIDQKRLSLITKILVICVVVLFTGSLWGQYGSWNLSNGYHNYILETEIIRENTEPGAVIGMTGGGVTAYFIQDRTIVNLDGLINGVEYFQQLRQGNADEYFQKIHIGYVYGAESMLLDSDPYRWILQGRLQPIKTFGESTLYRFQLAGQLGISKNN